MDFDLGILSCVKCKPSGQKNLEVSFFFTIVDIEGQLQQMVGINLPEA